MNEPSKKGARDARIEQSESSIAASFGSDARDREDRI